MQTQLGPSGTHIVASLMLVVALPFGLFGTRANQAQSEGAQSYGEGDFASAAEQYERALIDYPESPELQYDLGASLYKEGDLGRAREALGRAAQSASSNGQSELKQRAHFAAGNAQFMQGRYEEAIQSYDEALAIDPEDQEAIENKALAELMLQPPPPSKQEQPRDDGQQQENQGDQENDESGQGDQEQRDEPEPESEPGDTSPPETQDEQPPPQQPPGPEYPPMPEEQADELLEQQRERESRGAAVLRDPSRGDFDSLSDQILRDLGIVGDESDAPPW